MQPTEKHYYSHDWLTLHPENFPVASFLLPSDLRLPILAFYAFARGADQIADDPLMKAQDKREALETLIDVLDGEKDLPLPPFAIAYAEQMDRGVFSKGHGKDLVSAFLQDTFKTRYQDFVELMDYCQRSAAPVGRAVLEIAREKGVDLEASDALCNALQLLNHIQDCSKDFLVLDRIYLPQDWMRDAGVSKEDLHASVCSPGLRIVIHQLLDECDLLIARAKPLPDTIAHPRLQKEIRWIWHVAHTLCQKLRREDPLHERVVLSKWEMLGCFMRALWKR